jgi:hypothetical protein
VQALADPPIGLRLPVYTPQEETTKMSGYYNDVMMQQEHRQDLLNEAHLDRVAREARGGRSNRMDQLASTLISRLGCQLVK